MAKAKPGEINYASAGNGTGQHLSMELFKLMTGINLTHVPYRGAAPAYADVISGQVPVFFDNLASALGQIKGGHVRALAVTGTNARRCCPTCRRSRKPACRVMYNYVWFGLWAPKSTPQPIIDKLHTEIQKAHGRPGGEANASQPMPAKPWTCRSPTSSRS